MSVDNESVEAIVDCWLLIVETTSLVELLSIDITCLVALLRSKGS